MKFKKCHISISEQVANGINWDCLDQRLEYAKKVEIDLMVLETEIKSLAGCSDRDETRKRLTELIPKVYSTLNNAAIKTRNVFKNNKLKIGPKRK